MLVNYSLTLKQIDRYAAHYNKDQKALGSQLRGPLLHTLKEIMRIYAASLSKAYKRKPFTPETIPSLRTNNIQLATLTKTSGRTIQRHIIKLKAAGIITKKVTHGRKRNYELWITSKILWISRFTTYKEPDFDKVLKKSLSLEKQVVKKPKKTNCPQSDTGYLTRNKINKVIAVDKYRKLWKSEALKDTGFTESIKTIRSLLPQTNFYKTGDVTGDVTGDTQLKDPQKKDTQLKEPRRDGTTNRLGGSSALGKPGARNPEKLLITNPDSDPDRHSFLVSYAQKLWELAQKELYADKRLVKNQHRTALDLIYQYYKAVKTPHLEKAHTQFVKRIKMVSSYVKRDQQNRFIPIPSIYFDLENPDGFRGTKDWFKKAQKNYFNRKLQHFLRKKIQEIKHSEQRDTGEGDSRLGVFTKCSKEVTALGIPKLTTAFHGLMIGKNIQIHQLNFI